MKIRIKGNSLRYRLTKSDVATLWTQGHLEESTEFIGGTLVYGITRAGEDDHKLAASFTGDRIILTMPKSMIDQLNDTDIVGFDDNSGHVSLLVEKDFVCIDNSTEDQSDSYSNPHLTC